MRRHGISHGAAVLVCTITSALLVDLVKKQVPVVYRAVENLAELTAFILALPYGTSFLNIVIYASMLAMIWGVAFSFLHRD